MKLYIKFMVSLRCKLVVKSELDKLGLHHLPVDLGVVEIMEDITDIQRRQLKDNLLVWGLELMDDGRSILVERIRTLITEMIYNTDVMPEVKYSEYISEKLKHNYVYLSNIFSEVNGMSIQQFMIIEKIEKAKELLLYGELNLTEIAFKLHYSSVAHLSNQFKKITGLTPSYYTHMKGKRDTNLEDAGIRSNRMALAV